jgi:hypothetical protein
MIDLLAYLSWLFANVGVPILAPIGLLPLLNFSLAYREIAADALKTALRHGQLFWTVIAMCAGACYELGYAMDKSMSAGAHAMTWLAFVWHTLFIIVSSVIVVFGAADAQACHGQANARRTEKMMISVSLSFTLLIAITFSMSHYLLSKYLSQTGYNHDLSREILTCQT